MKLCDRYVLRGFLFSFAVVFVAMVALTIMIDMVVNLDEFLKTGDGGEALGAWAALKHICSYYFYRTLEYFQWLCGAAILVGAAFALARLNKTNELTAFKASGVSVYRLLWPIIVCGFIISLVYVVNQELIIPRCIDQLTGERSLAGPDKEFTVRHIEDKNNSLIHAPAYIPRERAMVAGKDQSLKGERIHVPITIVLRNDRNEHQFFIYADRAEYDPKLGKTGGWRLYTREYDQNGKPGKLIYGGRKIKAPQRGKRGESPRDIGQDQGQRVFEYETDVDPVALTRRRSSEFFRYLSFAGTRKLLDDPSAVDPKVAEVAMHKHFSKPILNIVLLLLGLPFVVGQEGKSYFISVIICIVLFVFVLGFEYAATEFGQSGYVHPALAAYLPVFIFTPVAIIAMESIRT